MTPVVASNSGPVFLLCTERSGSNLIEQVLGAHPEVCILSSVHHGVRLLRHFHYTLPTPAAPSGTESAAWRMLVARAARRTAWLRSEDEAKRLLAELGERQPIAAADLARFLYLELPQDAEGRLVVVKERGLQHLMFFYLGTFPNARFVFQVRDPRDFLLSAQSIYGGWPRNVFGSTRQALACWDQDQRLGLAALGLLGAKRVHLQRYEDLVADPERTLRALAAFLSIKWDERMLAFHEGANARRRSQHHAAAFRNLAKPMLRDNYGKWRRGLSSSAVKTVEAHLGDLMDRFGYPREHHRRNARLHLLKALLLAPLEHVANRDLHLWRDERDVERDLRSLRPSDKTPLLPPLTYPSA